MDRPKLRLGMNGLTAAESLDLFLSDDKPIKVLLAEAAGTWGAEYEEYLDALNTEAYETAHPV